MPFLSQKASSAVAGGTGGGYLNPSKIQSGSSVRFALLSDQPLEFFECWGEAEDGSVKPFRFAEDPSDADIKEEMGDAYSRRLNREGTAPEGVKFAIAAPVYNFDTEGVQIMQLYRRASSASWTASPKWRTTPTCWSMTSSSAKRAMA